MQVLRRAVAEIVHVRHIAVVDQVAHIVKEVLVSLGGDTQDRMVLAIVGLDILEETIVVLAEILVLRRQSSREIICTQIYDSHSRMEIGLGSIPTIDLGRVLIEGLEITIRHPPAFELGVVVAGNTHTRVCNSHIISPK